MRYFSLILILSSNSLIQTPTLFAMPAQRSNFDAEFEEFRSMESLEKDGTGIEERYMRKRLLDNVDPTKYSQDTTQFNSNMKSVKSIEAYVTNGKNRIRVPKENITVKSVADGARKTDEINQISIIYPGLQRQSVTEVTVKYKIKSRPVPDHMSEFIERASTYLSKSRTAEYISYKPLYFEKHDPFNEITILSDKVDGKYRVRISIDEKAIRSGTGENFVAPPIAKSWVNVSSDSSFEEYYQGIAKRYEKSLDEKLPPLFQGYVEKAKKFASADEQAESILLSLANDVYYIQFYKSSMSHFFPRKLVDIANTKFGDCKDYAFSTTSMLRSLGWKAHVAVVDATERYYWPNLRYPSFTANHAIVYAEKNGKTYWLDPTRNVVNINEPSSFIADRPGYVLTENKKDIVKRIPVVDYRKNIYSEDVKVEGTDDGFKFATKLHREGVFAEFLTAAEIGSSKPAVEKRIVEEVFGTSPIIDVKFKPFDFSSRLVRPMDIELSGIKKYAFMDTTAGHAFYWSGSRFFTIAASIESNRVEDIVVNKTTGVLKSKRRFEGQYLVGSGKKCEVDSKWFRYERDYGNDAGTVYLNEIEEIKKNYISAAEFKTEEFTKDLERLRDCGGDITLVMIAR